MKKTIICTIICLVNLTGCALNRNSFPPALQQVLDERITEVKSEGGICIAGRVKMSDGARINGGKDVKINFLRGVDAPLWVYDGGWFVMNRTYQPGSYPRPAKLILRAFGYDPIDATIAVMQGEMTYVEFEMNKTPSEKLASVTGIVVNDQNEPINGARVSLSFSYAYNVRSGAPRITIHTGPDGRYSFDGLSLTQHRVVVNASGYASLSSNVTPLSGKTTIKELTLHPNLGVVIDYVYQADGSCSFTGGDLQTGTIEWVNGHEGVDFSDGRVEEYDHRSLRDIEMRQDQGMLNFQIFYFNGENGFYDAGILDFESLTETSQTGYSTNKKACVVGHTYVVRTYEDNYAKFVVKSIFRSE